MTRYDLPDDGEGLYEPGSNCEVFRNRLGITDKEAIDQVEFDALVRVQADYVERITPDTQFDAALLREMHRDWLCVIFLLRRLNGQSRSRLEDGRF